MCGAGREDVLSLSLNSKSTFYIIASLLGLFSYRVTVFDNYVYTCMYSTHPAVIYWYCCAIPGILF